MMRRGWWLAGIGVVLGALAFYAKGRVGAPAVAEAPFRLALVQAEDLQVSVHEVGVVDPATKVEVKAAVAGRVVAIRVREGDQVRRGQLLAEVEPDVNQAQSLSAVQGRVSRAELEYRHAEADYAQVEALYREGLETERKYRETKVRRDLAEEALHTARAEYQIVEDRGIPISGNASTQLARVTAPMDGTVIKKGVEPGDSITSGVSSFNAGTGLFTVADLGTLIVRVNLNEVDIAKVRVGQPARLTLDAYPEKSFPGRVRFLAPAAETVDKIKVFKVELALDRPEPSLRPGMSANVEILGDRRERALSVPLEALQRRDGQMVVYRLKPNLAPSLLAAARAGLAGRSKAVWLSDHWRDDFDPVPVQTGVATLERVEVSSGLAGGDQVCLEDPTRARVERDEDGF